MHVAQCVECWECGGMACRVWVSVQVCMQDCEGACHQGQDLLGIQTQVNCQGSLLCFDQLVHYCCCHTLVVSQLTHATHPRCAALDFFFYIWRGGGPPPFRLSVES
jgi:hypothetical protein